MTGDCPACSGCGVNQKLCFKLRLFACGMLLAATLFCCLFVPIHSAAASINTVRIATKAEWLEFKENCRLDSFSKGLSVKLTADIDLSGETDYAVPVFFGNFDGGGHTVSGMTPNTDAERTGLFRIIEKDATVGELNVSGSVTVTGQSGTAGMICGVNRGTIRNCAAAGRLDAYNAVGGIAGINEQSGKIIECSSSAELSGTYKIGGIVGVNAGEIHACTNTGGVNLSANERSRNIGGIAGTNTGMVTGCMNSAEIGYLHTGYNVGGIAGLNSGFTGDCINNGNVRGRRDIGGIIGQSEPFYKVEYGKNTLEILNESILGFSDALDETISNLRQTVQDGGEGLRNVLEEAEELREGLSADLDIIAGDAAWLADAEKYLDTIEQNLETLWKAFADSAEVTQLIAEIELIIRELRNAEPSEWVELLQELEAKIEQLRILLGDIASAAPALKALAEALNGLLSVSISGLRQAAEDCCKLIKNAEQKLDELTKTASEYLELVKADGNRLENSVQKCVESMRILRENIRNVLNGNGGNIEDVSENAERDAENQAGGMAAKCRNFGDVSGDYGIGGIIGNLSKELPSDLEEIDIPSIDDVLFTDTTLFIRATVFMCSNDAVISAKYDNAGGILGYGSRGFLLGCESGGSVKAGREYAGGIAGRLSGTIRECGSITALNGKAYVGGIAGSAKSVIDCAAVPTMLFAGKSSFADGAYIGAIAGELTEECRNNIFADTSKFNDSFDSVRGLGGIDGISYAGIAYAVSLNELAEKAKTTNLFKKVTVKFSIDGKITEVFEVPCGGRITDLPQVGNEQGKYWRWDDFGADCVTFSQTVSGEWHRMITTIATNEEIPQILVEGIFDDEAYVVAEDAAEFALKNGFGEGVPTAAFRVRVFGAEAGESTYTVRCLAEEDCRLSVLTDAGWTEREFERDGKYIVFELNNNGIFAIEKVIKKDRTPYIMIVCGAIILTAAFAAVIAVKRRRGKNKAE